LNFTLYADETGFAALRGEWNDLLRRSRFDTIFLTWEWQTTWWRALGAPRGPLYILAAREEARLIGILPLYLTSDEAGRMLRVVGCFEVADYLDLIVEAGQEEAVYRAFLDWLIGPEAPAWDALDLCNQPTLSLAHRRLPELARARGWSAEVTQEDVCPVIALPGGSLPSSSSTSDADGWETYLATLDKKERHEIRRKLRRVEREAPDAALRIVRGHDGLTEAVTAFIALHRLSRRDKDAFMDEQMQSFFHALAATCAEHGWLQLSFLEVGGEPIASYFCFEYNNEVQVYNSGYDPQAYSQLSPGWVLLARLIQEAIAQGCVRFDFLQGDEDYKHRFGGVDEPVYRTLIRR
jgi:CelD/BcsL family acetyltransferase involved in cellulose biosynthesis